MLEQIKKKSELDLIHGRLRNKEISFEHLEQLHWNLLAETISNRIAGLGIAIVLCTTIINIAQLLAKNA